MNQNLSEGQRGLVTERALADLRGLIWAKCGKKGDFAELAEGAGLAKSTIQNFMFLDKNGRQTRRPHFETVAKLAKALGRRRFIDELFEGSHKPINRGQKKLK